MRQVWQRGTATRDGFTAGVLGATAVAMWILGTGAVAGRPLDTPARLGGGLVDALAGGAGGQAAGALAYFVVQYVLCTGVALVLASIVHRSDRQPSLLLGAALGFVLFQFAFTGLTALLAQSRIGPLAWLQFAGGNVIAGVVTAVSLYRSHPSVRGQFAHAAED
jgi:hypothetical protein